MLPSKERLKELLGMMDKDGPRQIAIGTLYSVAEDLAQAYLDVLEEKDTAWETTWPQTATDTVAAYRAEGIRQREENAALRKALDHARCWRLAHHVDKDCRDCDKTAAVLKKVTTPIPQSPSA